MNVSLIELNTLREMLGRKPLKSWKESKTKLAEQIALMGNEAARIKKTSPAVAVKTSSPSGTFVKLTAIARECKVDDRMARQKFRRLYSAGDKSLPALINDKWLFSEGDVARVRELLTTDQRSKK